MVFVKRRALREAARACDQRVSGSPAALGAILRLLARHGRLTLHHTGGSVGTVTTHHPHRPLHAGRHEACIGIVGGAPFFVDYDEDAELGYPDFKLDLAPPPADELAAEPRLISRAVAPGKGRPRTPPALP